MLIDFENGKYVFYLPQEDVKAFERKGHSMGIRFEGNCGSNNYVGSKIFDSVHQSHINRNQKVTESTRIYLKDSVNTKTTHTD
jgi:hypothetical protein